LERKKNQKAKEEFLALLSECTEISGKSRFREIQPLLETDARFKAVTDDRSRQDWFYAFVAEKDREEKEIKCDDRI
jgi:pre-mRNA-processing factor 40